MIRVTGLKNIQVQKFTIDLFLVTSAFFEERDIITLFSIKRSDD